MRIIAALGRLAVVTIARQLAWDGYIKIGTLGGIIWISLRL